MASRNPRPGGSPPDLYIYRPPRQRMSDDQIAALYAGITYRDIEPADVAMLNARPKPPRPGPFSHRFYHLRERSALYEYRPYEPSPARARPKKIGPYERRQRSSAGDAA